MEELLVATRSLTSLQLKDRFLFLWNLAVPMVMFFLFPGRSLLEAGPGAAERVVFHVMPFLSYSLFMTGMQGVGVRLLDWRERGFLRTLVQGRTGLVRLAAAMALSTVFTGMVFSAVFFGACAYFWGTAFVWSAWPCFALLPLLQLVVTAGSFLLARLKQQPETVAQVMNFCMIVLLITWSYGIEDYLRSGSLKPTDLGNPLAMMTRLLFFPLTGHSPWSDFAILAGLSVAGVWSLGGIAVSPVRDRS